MGIHDGHNSSVALLKNGRLVEVLQEERYVRVKNTGNVPVRATADLVARNALGGQKLQASLNGLYMCHGIWDRAAVVRDYESSRAVDSLFKRKARSNRLAFSTYQSIKETKRLARLHDDLGSCLSEITAVEHHEAHAAAAYHGWGIDEPVLVLTCDGSGDGLCATVNIGERRTLTRVAAVADDNSIGRLYSYLTYLLGMIPLEHEYKLMGLAPYAQNSPGVKRVHSKLRSLFEFDQTNGGITWKRSSGVPSMYAPMKFLDKLVYRERFDCIAAGLQAFLEEFLAQWVRNCIRETGIRKLALSGGVFMNVKANKTIWELAEVDDVFIFPSCGDESNAIGAAYSSCAKDGRANIAPLQAIYFGCEIDDREVESAIRQQCGGMPVQVEHKDDIEKEVATLLARGEIVGRVKGEMEFGARSLGNRSILAGASNRRVVGVINDMIKNRDFWMPFAPSVLAEKSEAYFVKPKPVFSPYMMLTFDSKPEVREKIAACVHQSDHTSRPQEVTAEFNPDYYRLIKYYEDMTGDAIILNTSYNLHGYPIVRTPVEALEVFCNSGLKNLALGNFLIRKVEA